MNSELQLTARLATPIQASPVLNQGITIRPAPVFILPGKKSSTSTPKPYSLLIELYCTQIILLSILIPNSLHRRNSYCTVLSYE